MLSIIAGDKNLYTSQPYSLNCRSCIPMVPSRIASELIARLIRSSWLPKVSTYRASFFLAFLIGANIRSCASSVELTSCLYLRPSKPLVPLSYVQRLGISAMSPRLITTSGLRSTINLPSHSNLSLLLSGWAC